MCRIYQDNNDPHTQVVGRTQGCGRIGTRNFNVHKDLFVCANVLTAYQTTNDVLNDTLLKPNPLMSIKIRLGSKHMSTVKLHIYNRIYYMFITVSFISRSKRILTTRTLDKQWRTRLYTMTEMTINYNTSLLEPEHNASLADICRGLEISYYVQ